VYDRHLFTSESVTEGHPDKVADAISDAILDAILTDDPKARVACETLVTTGLACVAGEITTTTYVPVPDIVRATIARIGYTDASFGFDCKTCAVVSTIDRQSPDIAMGVDTGGAGDQGMMFGFACRETKSLMPLPIYLAHRLVENHASLRESGAVKFFRPDAKSQVTVEYNADGTPHRIHVQPASKLTGCLWKIVTFQAFNDGIQPADSLEVVMMMDELNMLVNDQNGHSELSSATRMAESFLRAFREVSNARFDRSPACLVRRSS